MDRTLSHLNDDQMAAQIGLKQWITKLRVLDLPQAGNGDELISTEEMRRALEWINVLFFGGDMPELTFRWLSNSEDAEELESKGHHPREAYSLHDHEYCDEQGHIYVTLISDCIAGDFGSYRKLSILSVLVHEALHAFLDRYGCGYCKTFPSNVDSFHGHGRAWQLLALQLEKSFAALIGLPLDMGRFGTLIALFEKGDALPTRCDLDCYELRSLPMGRENDEGYDGEDVREMVGRTLAKYEESESLGLIEKMGQLTVKDEGYEE
jgi:hypothetical protein